MEVDGINVLIKDLVESRGKGDFLFHDLSVLFVQDIHRLSNMLRRSNWISTAMAMQQQQTSKINEILQISVSRSWRHSDEFDLLYVSGRSRMCSSGVFF